MSEEGDERKNIVDKINNAFTDFVGNVFGESGKDFIEETAEKVKEFSSEAINKFIEFSDSVFKENEQYIKARDSIEDVLKQTGFLKESEEEEEF
ncbi:MAG: hypothetical protein KGD58_11675 [Candidatus Lokiarchaeota archaeon]|nr:hypothetical protein [Candidatus Lokiarchaeota archaeon]